MKKGITFIFLFLPAIAFSQVRMYNSSLIDTSICQLFQYFPNDIVIRDLNAGNKIVLKSIRSEVQQIKNNVFRVRPGRYHSDTLKVYRNGKLVKAQAYSIDTLPELIVRIDSYSDTVLTIPQILSVPILKAHYAGCNYKSNVSISVFVMTVETGDGHMFSEYGVGDRLTAAQISVIKKLAKGSRLHFEEIRAISPDSRAWRLRSFMIIIR